MLSKSRVAIATLSLIFVSVTAAQAADPAIKCESGKLKEAGKYGNCRLKADSKGVKKGLPADYTKCETKFADKWAKTESKAGVGICPSEGDQASMGTRITTDAAEIATLLAGGSVSACGDGTVDVGEYCDFGDLNGETCAKLGLFGEGLSCTPGSCVLDTSGCSATRYEDTGLGSVIDHQTGLEWQKSDNAGGLTDWDNYYTSSPGTGEMDGTAFTVFLSGLNTGYATLDGDEPSGEAGPTTGCYAGHCDWRLPLIEEFKTIVDTGVADCGSGSPCIDQAVFGPTKAQFYWAATRSSLTSNNVKSVQFFNGNVDSASQGASLLVRAVRTGP